MQRIPLKDLQTDTLSGEQTVKRTPDKAAATAATKLLNSAKKSLTKQCTKKIKLSLHKMSNSAAHTKPSARALAFSPLHDLNDTMEFKKSVSMKSMPKLQLATRKRKKPPQDAQAKKAKTARHETDNTSSDLSEQCHELTPDQKAAGILNVLQKFARAKPSKAQRILMPDSKRTAPPFLTPEAEPASARLSSVGKMEEDESETESQCGGGSLSTTLHTCPACGKMLRHGRFVRHIQMCIKQHCDDEDQDSDETSKEETSNPNSETVPAAGQEQGRCTEEREGLPLDYVFCQLCQKDLSHLNSHRRLLHINKCMDEEEKKKEEMEERQQALEAAKTQVLDCPVCGKALRTASGRKIHLKKCASSHGVGPEQLLAAVKRQEEEHLTTLAAGVLPSRPGRSTRQNSTNTRKGIGSLPKSKLDEDTQLALALSSSLRPDTEEAGTSTATAASRKGRKNKQEEDYLLLKLSESQAAGRIEARVSDLIMMEAEDEQQFIPPLPQLNQQSLHGQIVKWSIGDTSEQCKMFWRLASLEHPGEKRGDSSAVDSLQYYVSALMPPVQMSTVMAGSKIRRMSEIPGRRRSLEAVKKMEASSCDEQVDQDDSGHQDENVPPFSTQTAALLADMAAEADGMDWSTQLSSSQSEISGIEQQVHHDLLSAFCSLVNKQGYSDVVIHTAESTSLYAHRIILSVRCPPLLQLLDAESGAIDLHDCSPQAVLAMLRFLYAGDTRVDPNCLPSTLQLAHRFGLASFAQICRHQLESTTASKVVDCCTEEKEQQSQCLSSNSADVQNINVEKVDEGKDTAASGCVEDRELGPPVLEYCPPVKSPSDVRFMETISPRKSGVPDSKNPALKSSPDVQILRTVTPSKPDLPVDESPVLTSSPDIQLTHVISPRQRGISDSESPGLHHSGTPTRSVQAEEGHRDHQPQNETGVAVIDSLQKVTSQKILNTESRVNENSLKEVEELTNSVEGNVFMPALADAAGCSVSAAFEKQLTDAVKKVCELVCGGPEGKDDLEIVSASDAGHTVSSPAANIGQSPSVTSSDSACEFNSSQKKEMECRSDSDGVETQGNKKSSADKIHNRNLLFSKQLGVIQSPQSELRQSPRLGVSRSSKSGVNWSPKSGESQSPKSGVNQSPQSGVCGSSQSRVNPLPQRVEPVESIDISDEDLFDSDDDISLIPIASSPHSTEQNSKEGDKTEGRYQACGGSLDVNKELLSSSSDSDYVQKIIQNEIEKKLHEKSYGADNSYERTGIKNSSCVKANQQPALEDCLPCASVSAIEHSHQHSSLSSPRHRHFQTSTPDFFSEDGRIRRTVGKINYKEKRDLSKDSTVDSHDAVNITPAPCTESVKWKATFFESKDSANTSDSKDKDVENDNVSRPGNKQTPCVSVVEQDSLYITPAAERGNTRRTFQLVTPLPQQEGAGDSPKTPLSHTVKKSTVVQSVSSSDSDVNSAKKQKLSITENVVSRDYLQEQSKNTIPQLNPQKNEDSFFGADNSDSDLEIIDTSIQDAPSPKFTVSRSQVLTQSQSACKTLNLSVLENRPKPSSNKTDSLNQTRSPIGPESLNPQQQECRARCIPNSPRLCPSSPRVSPRGSLGRFSQRSSESDKELLRATELMCREADEEQGVIGGKGDAEPPFDTDTVAADRSTEDIWDGFDNIDDYNPDFFLDVPEKNTSSDPGLHDVSGNKTKTSSPHPSPVSKSSSAASQCAASPFKTPTKSPKKSKEMSTRNTAEKSTIPPDSRVSFPYRQSTSRKMYKEHETPIKFKSLDFSSSSTCGKVEASSTSSVKENPQTDDLPSSRCLMAEGDGFFLADEDTEAANSSFLWSEENAPTEDGVQGDEKEAYKQVALDVGREETVLTQKEMEVQTPTQPRPTRQTEKCATRVPPSPFTPMPPYDDMTTPQLKNEVQRYGLKPVGKKRMKIVLKDIYHKTHQYETDSDCDEDASHLPNLGPPILHKEATIDGKAPVLHRESNRPRPRPQTVQAEPPPSLQKQLKKAKSQAPGKSRKPPALTAQTVQGQETAEGPPVLCREADLSKAAKRPKTMRGLAQKGKASAHKAGEIKSNKRVQQQQPQETAARNREEGPPVLLSCCSPSKTGHGAEGDERRVHHYLSPAKKATTGGISSSPEKSCMSSSQDSDASEQPDVSVFEEQRMDSDDCEEITPSQQLAAKDLPQKLMAFIRSRQDLYHKVLTYEPLDMGVLKENLKAAGIKCSQDKLLDFLDEKCITFTTKNMIPRKRRNRGRRPQSKKIPASQK